MKVRDLPKANDLLLTSLGAGAVFQWDGRIYLKLTASTFFKKPLDGSYAFDLNSSVIAHFNPEVKVMLHKNATLVLDGSTLEGIK